MIWEGGELPIKDKSKGPKSSKFSLVKSFPERSPIVDSVGTFAENGAIYSDFSGRSPESRTMILKLSCSRV